MDGAFGDLMVGRIGMIEGAQRMNVPSIECGNPGLHNITWSHGSRPILSLAVGHGTERAVDILRQPGQ
jgi:hypothetical protein